MAQPGKTLDAYESIQAQLEQHLAAQATLLKISQVLASSFDITDSLPNVTRLVQEVTGADVVRIALTEGNNTAAFGTGKSGQQFQDFDSSMLELAQNSGQSQFSQISQHSGDLAIRQMTSFLEAIGVWPLQVAHQLLGVLWVGYVELHEFTQHEESFLSTVASQTAVGIANAFFHKEAQHGRKHLDVILGSTSDPMLVVNRQGDIWLINHAASEMLNIDAASAIGTPVEAVLKDYPRLLELLDHNAEFSENEKWESPDGRTFSPRLARVESEVGAFGGYVLTLRDITSFKLLNKNQAELVRLVSHDLRSPLTFMQGYASLLGMTGALNERQTGFVEKILNGISQMTALVDNIQDAGRWDPQTGFYEMAREPGDVTKIVRDIVSNHQQVAEKQGITLTATIAPTIPIVNIDSLMIERALINLVSNAIKYSPDGGKVDASVSLTDNAILICISDTGLGIAPEHLEQLFQRGVRIVTPEIKEHRIKGSGLGLFIVRSVARRHGGDVWVESELGKGSKFYFSIPLRGENLIGGGD